jgi:hypothetical protein
MNFQNSILILSIVLLIVGTIVLSYSIKSSIKSQQWPPYIANCPDYWVDTTGDGTSCSGGTANVNLGLTGCHGVVNFDRMNVCDKMKVSNKCGIYWDGITYGNNQVVSKCG